MKTMYHKTYKRRAVPDAEVISAVKHILRKYVVPQRPALRVSVGTEIIS